jgi:hypothetical protein
MKLINFVIDDDDCYCCSVLLLICYNQFPESVALVPGSGSTETDFYAVCS